MAAAFNSDYYPSMSAVGALAHLHNGESYDGFVSPLMSRAESVASDGQSMVSSLTANMPSYIASVRPSPEYISPANASIVATESQYSARGSVSEDDDEVTFDRHGRAAVAEGAVALVNGFLDRLLHDFFSTARSTSLLALRPAVSDVLRKSLARDAIARAQGDLEDLLALQDSDEEEEKLLRTPKEAANSKWNMEFIWKRARLRVMMRSEKSEFDIDDDEKYVQQEGLFQGRRFSQTTVISLSSEIFLAGVLDFIAEQLLSFGAMAAATRIRRQGVNAKGDPRLRETAHILVQESDVEKAALNSSMERLWRNWRKSLRARGLSTGRRSSRSASMSPALTRRESVADTIVAEKTLPSIPDMGYPEHVIASNIPISSSAKDVDEIETPWLTRDPDEKVPQQHVTNGRINHRADSSVGNFSYFRPMRTNVEPVTRPSTSPQPAPTPFVDAPGAWPAETPAEELHEPKPDLGGASKLQDEAISRSADEMIKAPSSPNMPIAEMRTSPIPTLDPSQLDSFFPQQYTELGTHRDQKPASPAAAGTALHGFDWTDQQGVGREVRLSEEFTRKSIGDMRSLITDSATPRGHVNSSNQAVNGTFFDDDDWEDEEPTRPTSRQSTYTTQSYSLHDPTKPQTQSQRATPQHMPAIHADHSGSSESLSAPSPTVGRPVSNDSPVLPPSTLPLKFYNNGYIPQRLSLSGGNSSGLDTRRSQHASSSPRNFLASRALSAASSSSSSASSMEQESRPSNLSADQSVSGATAPETPKAIDGHYAAPRDAPRALQGLGISRQTSDEFKHVRRGSPILQQPSPEDRAMGRQSSKIVDGEVSSLGSKRSSLKRPYPAEKLVNLEEAGKSSTSLSKLTSASITSPEDFDLMIRGDDTIKYTLTPESARGVPVSAYSSVQAKAGRNPSFDTQLGPRPSSRSGVASVGKSSLPKDKQKPPLLSRKSSISRPAPKNKKPTAAGTLAREATVQTQSTQDFADFIRTTGPETEPNTFIPLLASKSMQSLRSLATSQANSRSHSPATERSRSLSAVSVGKQNMEAQNIPPVPAMPVMTTPAPLKTNSTKPQNAARPGPQLRARGANGSAGAGNSSELIDFIRNGPAEAGSSRIPRNVAPFRTTMDSDELQLLSDKLDTEKQLDLSLNSYGSTTSNSNYRDNSGIASQFYRPNTSTSTSSQPPSARSSSNSQAKLLPGNSNIASPPATTKPAATSQPAYSSPPVRLGVPGSSVMPPGTLERKRHRNKDPYPIDDSEDDDLLTALPRDRRPEESLVDFLRNNEPPPNNAPKPLAPAGQAQARALLNKARANSINSLRAAAATSQSHPYVVPASPTESRSPGPSSMSPNSPPQTPTTGFRSDASSIAPSTRSMTSNTTARPAHITAQVTSAGSIPQSSNRSKMQVRGAGEAPRTARLAAHEMETGDLADFLRSSGPTEPARTPIPIDSAPGPVVGTKGQKVEKKKVSKFWKRKTYLDLP